jgi:hypothetical protein
MEPQLYKKKDIHWDAQFFTHPLRRSVLHTYIHPLRLRYAYASGFDGLWLTFYLFWRTLSMASCVFSAFLVWAFQSEHSFLSIPVWPFLSDLSVFFCLSEHLQSERFQSERFQSEHSCLSIPVWAFLSEHSSLSIPVWSKRFFFVWAFPVWAFPVWAFPVWAYFQGRFAHFLWRIFDVSSNF